MKNEKNQNILILSLVVSVSFFIYVTVNYFNTANYTLLSYWCVGIVFFSYIFFHGFVELISGIKNLFKYRVTIVRKE